MFRLQPKVRDLIKDPSSISLEPSKKELKEVEELARTVEQKASQVLHHAGTTDTAAANTKDEAEKLEALVQMATDAADGKRTASHAQSLFD